MWTRTFFALILHLDSHVYLFQRDVVPLAPDDGGHSSSHMLNWTRSFNIHRYELCGLSALHLVPPSQKTMRPHLHNHLHHYPELPLNIRMNHIFSKARDSTPSHTSSCSDLAVSCGSELQLNGDDCDIKQTFINPPQCGPRGIMPATDHIVVWCDVTIVPSFLMCVLHHCRSIDR